jgi:SAM-dependent methyltransferase
MNVARHLRQLAPTKAEDFYNRLTGYGFARRYVGGRSVVDLCCAEPGYGARVLAETAGSVASLVDSPEALELASTVYPAPNITYREAGFPKLPYPAEHFEVAVAVEVIENFERPEDVVQEIKRVLKRDGLLVVSTPDKQAYSNERKYRAPEHWREMYAPEFRELLERHFEHVHTYRQGAVDGGFVFRTSEKVTGASIETIRPSSTKPSFGVAPPVTRFVLAVCSDVEIPETDEKPYLLLDRDRRIFDECEDLSEDVELLRGEIQRMQETEVLSFQEALNFRKSEIAYLRAQLDSSETPAEQLTRLQNHTETLQRRLHETEKRLHAMENSTIWRLTSPYRRLRARIDARRKATPESNEGGNTDSLG